MLYIFLTFTEKRNYYICLVKIFIASILTSFFLLSVINTTAQNRQIITKTVLNENDSSLVVGAHIINLTTKMGVVSNNEGKFAILAAPTDSLQISSINYALLKKEVKLIDSKIYIKHIDYDMEVFNVLPYKNYAEFRKAFIELVLPDTSEKVNPSIYLSRDELISASPTGEGIIFKGVISGILASFNKSMKDQAKYEGLMRAQDIEFAMIVSKFNSTIVQNITHLSDPKEIKYFMYYCDFSPEHIKYTYTAKLEEEIDLCYKEYMSLPLASR